MTVQRFQDDDRGYATGVAEARFAGTVAEVGARVTDPCPRDEVFGWTGRSVGGGAFAEYARCPRRLVTRKPAALTFDQAAALPSNGVTALQAVRDWARVQPGQKVLINGASGGVGSFAVQIAKALGAEVTRVSSTANLVHRYDDRWGRSCSVRPLCHSQCESASRGMLRAEPHRGGANHRDWH